MPLPAVGICPVCKVSGYLTTKSAVKKHWAPGTYRAPDRVHCPGSGTVVPNVRAEVRP